MGPALFGLCPSSEVVAKDLFQIDQQSDPVSSAAFDVQVVFEVDEPIFELEGLRIRAKITWTFGDFLSIINLV